MSSSNPCVFVRGSLESFLQVSRPVPLKTTNRLSRRANISSLICSNPSGTDLLASLENRDGDFFSAMRLLHREVDALSPSVLPFAWLRLGSCFVNVVGSDLPVMYVLLSDDNGVFWSKKEQWSDMDFSSVRSLLLQPREDVPMISE